MTEIQRIEMHEIRKLLDAVQVLAVRPAQCTETMQLQIVARAKNVYR